MTVSHVKTKELQTVERDRLPEEAVAYQAGRLENTKLKLIKLLKLMLKV